VKRAEDGRFDFRKATGTGLPPRLCADLGKGEPYSSTVGKAGQRGIGEGCGLSYLLHLRADALRPCSSASQIGQTDGVRCWRRCVRAGAGPRRASERRWWPCWRRACGSPPASAAAGRFVTATCNPCSKHLSGSRSPPARRRRAQQNVTSTCPCQPSPQRRCPCACLGEAEL